MEVFRTRHFHWYTGVMDIFWHFRDFLSNNLHEVDVLKKGLVTNFALKNANMIIIGLPLKEISEDEILTIKEYVSDGGSLLLAGGTLSWPKKRTLFGTRNEEGIIPRFGGVILMNVDLSRIYTFSPIEKIEYLNRLSHEFGIRFTYDLLVGGKKYLPEKSDFHHAESSYHVPIITNFSPHPILEGISGIVIADGCPIQIHGDVQAIAISDDDTEPSRSIVLAVAKFGHGKVVALSSPSIFVKRQLPYGLQKMNHLFFATNLINWLVC